MTTPFQSPLLALLQARGAVLAGIALALAYLLTADYPPLALSAIVSVFFAAYLWLRVMVFLENDRFTPNRLRVGLTWAFIGFHGDTDEFDIRPVRVYFLLLGILFTGLVLRPILGWITS